MIVMDKHILQEESKDAVSEPIVGYGTKAEIEEGVCGLPSDLLAKAAKLALEEHRSGQCIPHEEVMNSVRGEMGWK